MTATFKPLGIRNKNSFIYSTLEAYHIQLGMFHCRKIHATGVTCGDSYISHAYVLSIRLTYIWTINGCNRFTGFAFARKISEINIPTLVKLKHVNVLMCFHFYKITTLLCHKKHTCYPTGIDSATSEFHPHNILNTKPCLHKFRSQIVGKKGLL